jgi:oligopeptide/dipeptide ABC transporter ATP-binding protein
MDMVGLARRFANLYPHELDGGRRQRIGVARALSLSPRFIVCDEPVSALDVSIQAQILNLLMDLRDDMGLTYMFITHDLSVVRHISDEIMVMYMGQAVERALPEDLFQKPAHPYTRALLSAIPEPDIRMREKVVEVLRGEVTSPISPAPGCRFAPRCESAFGPCQLSDPLQVEIGPDHVAACHLYGEGAAA